MRFILLFIFGFVLLAEAKGAGSVTGKITTKDGAPVERATVHLLNTNYGAVSGADGSFAINDVPPGSYTVEISAVGYAATKSVITVDDEAVELSTVLSETARQLDDVVVTAEKKEDELQAIPSSVTALSSRQVERYRLWNSKDITAIVPNLYSADPGDGRNVTSIRGITSTSYDPAVATYIDGVNQFGLDTYISQLFDVERIEVLRGPQGTLYGRNAMGGVINIITKQPTNITRGFAEVNIGNYGQQRYAIGFRTPLIPNRLFLGVTGVYDRSNGFYKNLFDNSDFDKKHSVTGSYYLKFLANRQWTFTLNVKHNANRNNGTFPLSYAPFEQPFTVNQNAVGTMVDNTLNSSLTIASAGQAMNFTSQTSYQSNYRYYKTPLDGDFSPADAVSIMNNYGKDYNKVNVVTQEFKLSSAANTTRPLQWVAGTLLSVQTSPVKQATRFGIDAAPLAGDSLFSLINISKGVNTVVAGYGQATYTFFNKLDVTAGLRYDYVINDLRFQTDYQHDPDPTTMEILPRTSERVDYHAFSPKGSVAYRPTDHNLVYVSYSRGFRTGGVSTQVSNDPANPLYTYMPEYSSNYEIGLKNTFFDNRIRANISAFHIDVTDVQVPTLILPSAITVTRNTGGLTSRGVELELAATIFKGWQIEYNAGINDATYTSLNLALNNQTVDLKGNHQIFTPSTTSMLAVQYNHSFQIAEFFLRGEWMYLGDQYFDLANTIKQPSYSLLNARGGVTFHHVGRGDLAIALWCRNLTDRKYISYAYDFGAQHLGNPQNYGVTVRYSFQE